MAGVFDIQYADAVPSGRTGQVPLNVNVDTGGSMIGEAFSRMGQAIQGIGEQQQDAKNAIELSTLKRQYDEMGAAAYKSLQNVADEKEATQILEKFQKDVSGLRGNSQAVNDQFGIHVNDTITGWTNNFTNRIEKNKVQQLNDEFEVNYNSMLESGDYSGANELLGNLVKAGALTEVKANAKRTDFFGDSLLAQANRLINTGDEASLRRADGILSNLPNLKSSDGQPVNLSGKQLDVMDNLKVNLISTQNRVNSAMRQQKDKESWDLFKASEDGTLTLDMLDKSVIDADEKQEIWRNYKIAQTQKLNTGVSQIEEGDPAVLAQLNAIVDLAPEKITKAQIYGFIDKGLGTKHVTSLVDRLDRNIKEGEPVLKKYRAELGRLHESGLFGNKKNLQTSDTYLKLSKKLDTFLESNPTDDMARKFFATLIREDVSWGNSFGPNELPGFGENPLEMGIKTKAGTVQPISIVFGDVVEIDGQFYQAIGRKEGTIQWRKVNQP